MLVNKVMSSPALTVEPTTPIKRALALLDEHSITALPVVTATGRIAGVVSEADLIRDCVPRDPGHFVMPTTEETRVQPPHVVAEVMNPHPITVNEDSDLADAVDLMTLTAVKSLPVVDARSRVVGVISRCDVVHLLARPDGDIEADVDDLFRRTGIDWLVDVRDGLVVVRGPEDRDQASAAIVLASTVAGVVGVTVSQA